MEDVICPLCGKANPPDLEECLYCQAPLKTGGFLPPEEGKDDKKSSPPSSKKGSKPGTPAPAPKLSEDLEQSIPDWLKETEASFMEQSELAPEESTPEPPAQPIEPPVNPPPVTLQPSKNAIDDDWLESLLSSAGALETPEASPRAETPRGQEPEPASEESAEPILPGEKPDWLADLEASSKMKLEGGIFASEQERTTPPPAEVPEEIAPEPAEPPDWLTKARFEAPEEIPPKDERVEEEEKPAEKGGEAGIAPAELPGWLEAIRPSGATTPSGPVEDVSSADIVTAGPLVGLRGVISAHPSAIRAQKPPTYSIKLKVTDEQQARVQMMEELLADEEKPTPLPSRRIITTRYIFRLIVAIALLLPIIWMIISDKPHTPIPQPGDVPGVVDFTQHIQDLPANAPVLVAFDYEAGFSGELNLTINNVVTQLMQKNAYLTVVSTSSSGPALAESVIKNASSSLPGNAGTYTNYADLGFIPGGTLGLLGLATSPRDVLPYALDGSNVWAGVQLKSISTVKDFAAVIVITNDHDIARIWIEQVGPQLQQAGKPLLLITSSQAEPLIRPYYEAAPAQVQGIIAGLTGGVAYARAIGTYQQTGSWDAFSAGITISILILLIGSIAGVVTKMLASDGQKET